MNKLAILLVDDEALFRTSATDALELAFPGYQIVQAANGQQALDRIAEGKIDVVVTDISMPVMGGLELMLALREQRFPAPVIVVTAFGDRWLEGEVSLQGAFGYLEKPVDLQELVQVIQAAAEGAHSHIEGLTLAGFVQLLALERKTCRLRVSKEEKYGDLLFQDGVLVDAKLGRLIGDQAALILLGWDEGARLDLHAGFQPRRTTITETLNHLLLEAMRLKDETAEHEVEEAIALAETPPPTITETLSPEAILTGNVEEVLREAMELEGALGVALVDQADRKLLYRLPARSRLDLKLAGIGNIDVVRSKMKVMEELSLDDSIEDMLITLDRQYHLIRPLIRADHLFIYLVLDRERANLAMARRLMSGIEKRLVI